MTGAFDAALARARHELSAVLASAPASIDLHAHLQAVVELLEHCRQQLPDLLTITQPED